jgi:hypothetical protein
MPGYLDQYGAGEERRIKIIKTIAISLVSIVVIGGILFFVFHNFREEQRVKQFLALLGAGDYKAAYAIFGCTDSKPCAGYAFDKFMEDWGPKSGHGSVANARITRSRSCGSGVILTLDFGGNQQEKVWVERKNMTVGFPPFDGCPAGM